MSLLHNELVFFKSGKSFFTHLKALEVRRDLGRNVDGMDRYLPITFCA